MAIVEFKQHFEIEAKQFFLRTNIIRIFLYILSYLQGINTTQTYDIVRYYNLGPFRPIYFIHNNEISKM